MADPPLPNIPGYTLNAQLYAGKRTVVYQAIDEHDGKSVVIKVLRSHSPSVHELVRFRNQYTIAKNLDSRGIVKPLALVPWNHNYALIMEDVGGISLRDYVNTHGCLSVEQVMVIALQLSDSLHYLSQHRVLHKDINPANILIHSNTDQIWLTDFSIASLLPKESQELKSPGALEGTLAYIAPEQTGRMNRGIDFRADFYGLGVTLYELLTGVLPFQTNDPMELIHCHIAKFPIAPCEISLSFHPSNDFASSIPNPLSNIVLKLMAKNAEDRYQSALGLKHDLQQCLGQWQESKHIEPFELGQRDRSDHFLIPEKLYGREVEVQTLMDAFGRVSQGASELMLVAGFSGVGKTAVVKEIHKPIVEKRGYFVKGKYDQFTRNIPFSAFVQAFRDLVGQLLGESDTQLQGWKAKILETVGDNGQVLIDVIPELEAVIGPQPPVPELSASAAQNRFNLLFEKFIAVFATEEHPLVMFLDDLQWVDSASLNLLRLLTGENQTSHLLLLGAYRDNEVFPAHPLMLTLGDLEQQCYPGELNSPWERAPRKHNTTITTITLVPLSSSHINRLVAETLSCTRVLSEPLTDIIYQKTKGNPFFTIQSLKGLYEDGLIIFDHKVGHWECDLVQVRASALSDDVVEFMVGRLHRLSDTTQNVLKLAACIGNQFDLETLATICETPSSKVADDLWSALQRGLIFPQSFAYKFYQEIQEQGHNQSISVSYHFLHDRVQQAAYDLIGEDHKQITHLNIGRLLLQTSTSEEREKNLFKIVNQLNIGISLIEQSKEIEDLAQLNLVAAQKAKSAAAYNAAASYLNIAIELLHTEAISADPWRTHYGWMQLLHNLLAEVSYLNGEYESSQQQTQTVIDHAQDLLDHVRAYEIRISLSVAQGQCQTALDVGLEILSLLDISLDEAPLPDIDIDRLYRLPAITSPKIIAALSILSKLWAPALIAGSELLPKVILTMLNLSARHGNSAIGAFAYSLYGMLLCAKMTDIELGYRFGQLALHTLEHHEDAEFTCKVNQLFHAFIRNWKELARDLVECLADNVLAGLETGDIEFACYASINYCDNLFLIGESLHIIHKKQTYYIELAKSLQQPMQHATLCSWGQMVDNLMGMADEPTQLIGNRFDESEQIPKLQESGVGSTLFFIYTSKTILKYLFNDYEQALIHSQLAIDYEQAGEGMLPITQISLYRSLGLLALYSTFDLDRQAQSLDEVNIHQGRLRIWANHAPMNHQHKVDLVEAEKCRVLGQKLEALELYDQAIAGAKENEYLQEEALANELAARFYLDWGKEKIAGLYMQEAYYCYFRWGAKAKTRDLEAHYLELLQPILKQTSAIDPLATLHSIAPLTLSVHSSISSSQPATSNLNTALDLTTIFKSAQALSESIDLSELLETLAPMMLQTSGAERLALLLPDANTTWQIRVTATADKTQLVSVSLTDNLCLPVQLIQYVQRTQEILVVDGLDQFLPIVDPYLQDHRHRSVLCLPLLHQTKLIGLLYLEHHSVVGVFSRDRITILNFLCTQAAISLENALLNQALEQKLEAQTAKRQASETLFQNMVDNIPGVAYQVHINADGAVSTPYVSPNCYALYEVPAEAIMTGQYSFRDFEHNEDRPIVAQRIVEMSQTLQPCEHEFRIITPSGTLKWVQVFTCPVSKPDGSTVWDGIVMDVSDRKQAEFELQRTNEELKLATQHKSDFLASMSHELRTPLNAVIGFSQLLQSDYSLSHENHEMLATINRNGEYLLALINDILEMSKIEAGKITFNPKQVDYIQLLDDIRSTFKGKAKAKNLAFKVTSTSDIPRYLQIDAVKLRQILLNLLSNALKFTQAGEICFHTQVMDVGHDSSNEKVHLQFAVSDTGPGIGADDLEKIFEPFRQASAGRLHHQGTGLGLPISRKFAQMMGGDIQVASTLGQGSTFSCDIYAPVLSANKVDEIQPLRYQNVLALENQQQTYRLMIVDDNPDNRALLSQMLSIPGFEVRHAINGLQAVAMNESWQPHLIYMDIHMPQMDGLEATRQIRQSGLTPKIIAVSASAFADDHQAALTAGCDDFIAKPFNKDMVFELIASLLDVDFITAPSPIVKSGLNTASQESMEAMIQEGFSMMSADWQKQVQLAISSLDENAIQQLLDDIPREHQGMVDAMSSLVKDFRFDILVQILEDI